MISQRLESIKNLLPEEGTEPDRYQRVRLMIEAREVLWRAANVQFEMMSLLALLAGETPLELPPAEVPGGSLAAANA